ncbi:MAG: hypothetical protein ACTSR8_22185 [Promethearchaeota archaeon]
MINNSRLFSDGLFVPYPFNNEIMRRCLQSLSIAIIPYHNTKLLLDFNFKTDEIPENIQGSRLTKSAFRTVCDWLFDCSTYIKEEEWHFFLEPILDLIKFRIFMETLEKKSFSTPGILLAKSKPQFEKNFNSEMVTGTFAIPILQNYYSCKTRKLHYDNISYGNINFEGIQIFPVINQIRPIEIQILEDDEPVNYNALSFSYMEFNEIEKMKKSINLQFFTELFSEQKNKKLLGFPAITIGTIRAYDAFIYIKLDESDKVVQYYVTSTLMSKIGSISQNMIGKKVGIIALYWYHYGFSIPSYPECIDIIDPIDISAKKEPINKKESILSKYITNYKERIKAAKTIEQIINKELLTKDKLINIFMKKRNKYKNFITVIELYENREKIDHNKLRKRLLNDIDFFEFYGLVEIKNDKLNITEMGFNVILDTFINLNFNNIMNYTNKLTLFNKNILLNYFIEKYEIPITFSKCILNYLIEKGYIIKVNINDCYIKEYIKDIYYVVKDKKIKNIENILNDHYNILYSEVLEVLNKYTHGLALKAIMERISIDYNVNEFNYVIMEDIFYICEYLIKNNIIIKENSMYFYPFESRIYNLFDRNEGAYYSSNEIKKICNLPYYDYIKILDNIDFLDKIGKDIYYKKNNKKEIDLINDYIKYKSKNELFKKLEQYSMNRSKAINIMYSEAKKYQNLINYEILRSLCFDWYSELIRDKKIVEKGGMVKKIR